MKAIAAAASLGGSYSDYLDYHNYGYVLRKSGQIKVAVYDAKLIFHFTLPRWNLAVDSAVSHCRHGIDPNNTDECHQVADVMSSVGRTRRDTFIYVKEQVKRIYDTIRDLPVVVKRVTRGWGARLLSRITGLAAQEDVDAVLEVLQNVEAGIQESLKMWGDGSKRMTTYFKTQETRITNVFRIMDSQRTLIREIQHDFMESQRTQSLWVSRLVSKTIDFLVDDWHHRQQVDLLYNAMQQLMNGKLSHFLISHSELRNVLTRTQRHLQRKQPHMTLATQDVRYYYSEATFSVFRHAQNFFLAINAPVTFREVSLPFHVYEVTKLPLSTHHQLDFYTTLSTDITTIAFNRDSDYFLQITAGNSRPQGNVWHVTHPSVSFIDRSRRTCGAGLLWGNLPEIKAHCGYTVSRAPYPKSVIRLFENSFLFVNMSTLRVSCRRSNLPNGTLEHIITVSQPLIMKSFDCHCESVVADEFHILIDMSYCNSSSQFANSMDIQYPINLPYLSEYFDLEKMYNVTAQTFLNESLSVLLPNLATADKLWDEVMGEEKAAKFQMAEIINATKNSEQVYDHLAHYLFTQMSKVHYKPTDFDVMSPWAWMSIFGWILSIISLALVILLKFKVRSLTMVLMARAAHAAPLELPKVISLGPTSTTVTQDSIAVWADHMAHIPNLLPAEVLILLIMIFWTLFKLGRLLYFSYRARTARTRLILEVGNLSENVLLHIMDLPHPNRIYKMVVSKHDMDFVLIESNLSAHLLWHKGITMVNTILDMSIVLPTRLSVPLWKIKKLRSLLQMPYYAAVQIVSDVTTHEMEVIPLKTLPPDVMASQNLYPNLASVSMASLTRMP